ncbi:hypothetical protein FSB64_41070 [Paraburkholderia sp. JPY454]|uniref:Uncharacterized protein n=2 Tax=Paraburkholderia youngii TaxID=2782701 RepID=A0ABX2NZ57_9BURK|nr:hypothetical protein [Paraburkholderia youngii]
MTTRSHHLDSYLPSTFEALTQGGDPRIELDTATMINKYGGRPIPDTGLLAFGSATASTISLSGYSAAQQLRSHLLSSLRKRNPADVYLEEMSRLRSEFIDQCGLGELSGLEAIVSASGTDAHMLVARLVAGTSSRTTLAIMVQPEETGSGVARALAGALYHRYPPAMDDENVGDFGDVNDVESIAIRSQNGSLRSITAVDDELEATVSSAVKQYERILIVLTDVSKTGVLGPSPDRVLELKRRWPNIIETVIDASQFRLASSTLVSYLRADSIVIITGSKFFNGPPFSAMLLVPADAACRLMKRPVDPALRVNSARAEWPPHWNGIMSLHNASNFGLLLRWEAALAELRAFHSIPTEGIRKVVENFYNAITSWMSNSQQLSLLEQPALQRRPTENHATWDQIPTIFPFVLFEFDNRRRPLRAEETTKIFNRMKADLGGRARGVRRKILSARCELGQPVLCGEIDGVPVSALRMSLSARLIVEAACERDNSAEYLVERAISVLEKVSLLAKNRVLAS